MKLKLVKDYFVEWGSNKTSFVDMLQEKAYFAKVNNRKVYAFGKMRTPEELEQMLVFAMDCLR